MGPRRTCLIEGDCRAAASPNSTATSPPSSTATLGDLVADAQVRSRTGQLHAAHPQAANFRFREVRRQGQSLALVGRLGRAALTGQLPVEDLAPSSSLEKPSWQKLDIILRLYYHL